MIAVIGGSGFIGTRLLELLTKEGHEDFKIIDKTASVAFPEKAEQVNIMDLEKLKRALSGCDSIINLAAEHRDDVSPVSRYYDVNVQGAKHVCEAAKANEINKIIFTSSVAVYGLDKPCPDEKFPVAPFNDYGKSKLEAEEVFVEWYEEDPENRSLIIVRPTVVFGEKNRGNVYNLLRQIASGKFLMIGNGVNKKSMAYVGNVAAFLQYNLRNTIAGHQLFNYVDTPDLSMNELVAVCEESLKMVVPKVRIPRSLGMLAGHSFDLLSRITRRTFTISSVRVRKFCATTQYSAKAAHSTRFKAPFTLSEGLDRTLKSEFFEKK